MKMKKKLRNSVALGVVLLSMVACTGKTSTSESACGNNGQCSEQCKNECNQNNCKNKKEMTYSPARSCYGSNERHVRIL